MTIKKMGTKSFGFALPTVLIVSVIIMITATAILQGSLSSKAALENQYYESIAREAADAGLARARSCYYSDIKTWTVLKPNNRCAGTSIGSPDYVFKNGRLQSTFEVSSPSEIDDGSVRAKSTGIVSLIRSDGSSLVLARQSISQTINSTLDYDQYYSWAYNSISVSSVSSGNSHSCALARGKVYCWGDNTYGQLGNNSTTDSPTPVPVYTGGVLGGKVVTSITTSSVGGNQSHTCAIAEGKAYCWGFNAYGQLGNNSTTDSSVPVAVNDSGVMAGKTVTNISAGELHTCAIADSQAYCWGYNGYGQLGNLSSSSSYVPVAVYTGGLPFLVSKISAGSEFTCGISDGRAYCWGRNNTGQLGNGSTTNSNYPVPVSVSGVLGGKFITDISAGKESAVFGGGHACAVAGGQAYCWGYNGYGRLGNNSTAQSLVPVAVNTSGALNGKTVRSITAGVSHTCVIADNASYCWGDNYDGQLGNNSYDDSYVPVATYTGTLLKNKVISSISAGWGHTCAVANGQAYCWGDNYDDDLGSAKTDEYITVPVAVYADDVPAPVIIY